MRRWAATFLGVAIAAGVMALIELQRAIAEIDDAERAVKPTWH